MLVVLYLSITGYYTLAQLSIDEMPYSEVVLKQWSDFAMDVQLKVSNFIYGSLSGEHQL